MEIKKDPKRPSENQKTAAWANAQSTSGVSGEAHPSLEQVINAKEYTEENQK
ncbi:MAG: DUF3787 domain-containing protein [Clostridiales bacterium]|jgi:hypothetical protein|nr:DUF3787 domain-containing protein [Clostridiales bacterium]